MEEPVPFIPGAAAMCDHSPSHSPDPRRDWHWYHLILSTYGSWLPGDPRGFRTRHHRFHVEGDYKDPPPPGRYEKMHKQSQHSLRFAPVVLPPRFRSVLGQAVRERLERFGALVVCLAVTGQHLHVLAKMPFDRDQQWIATAKRHAWFEMRDHGWKGKLWGQHGKRVVVRDRQHQMNVYRYVLAHRKQGAWVWKWSQREDDSATGGQ